MSHPYKQIWDGVEQRVMLEHRLRAERALGRKLPKGAVVHHADGSVAPGAPLVLCPSQAYHLMLHVRMRVIALGGNPNTQRQCKTCKQLKTIPEFACNSGNRPCRACDNASRSERKWLARRKAGIPPIRRPGRSMKFFGED